VVGAAAVHRGSISPAHPLPVHVVGALADLPIDPLEARPELLEAPVTERRVMHIAVGDQARHPLDAGGIGPALLDHRPHEARRVGQGSSSSSAAVSRQSPAAALAAICAGLVAPAITDATPGREASPAIARSSRP
jgi:hypothetical protein